MNEVIRSRGCVITGLPCKSSEDGTMTWEPEDNVDERRRIEEAEQIAV